MPSYSRCACPKKATLPGGSGRRPWTQEIAEAQRQGDPDLGNTYYYHWASALERLCAEKGLVGRPDMDRRKEEWRRAYLNTPHGKPIELAAAFSPTRARAAPRCR